MSLDKELMEKSIKEGAGVEKIEDAKVSIHDETDQIEEETLEVSEDIEGGVADDVEETGDETPQLGDEESGDTADNIPNGDGAEIPYWEKLGYDSEQSLIAEVERAKVLNEQSKRPEQAANKGQPRPVAGFVDNEYPRIPRSKSKLPPEELDKRRATLAEALLDDPEGTIIDVIGETLERYLDQRDNYRAQNQTMQNDAEFLAANKEKIDVLVRGGYSPAEAYKVAKIFAGEAQSAKPSPKPKNNSKQPNSPAKVEKVRKEGDFPSQKKLTGRDLLAKLAKDELRRSGYKVK